MAIAISQNDPLLVAIKAELLHGIPELTGKQINTAAFLAVMTVRRLEPEKLAPFIPDTTMSCD